MDTSSLLLLLLACPLCACLIIACLPKSLSQSLSAGVHLASLAGSLGLCCYLLLEFYKSSQSIFALDSWLMLDSLSAIFVALVCLISAITGIVSLPYLKHEYGEGKLEQEQIKQYYSFFQLFVFTMLLACLSNNIIMMWVAVEATTLGTVFLVGLYKKGASLEAAWKYIIICTCGLAFGLYGTVLLYADGVSVLSNTHQAAFWTSLLPQAAAFDPKLMQIAFVFIAIGFGTKAGLFPMHTWLPDAHAEAPSPISALLSAVLLKCAFLVIMRFYILANACLGASFPCLVMMILGALSVIIAAYFFFAQKDLKRKLAYSSTENVGLIALCLGFGGPIGIFAALFHCVAHALTKALMFCLSGNILMKYQTRDLTKISGFLQLAPLSATLCMFGFLALAGFPPFAMFWSELAMFVAGAQGSLVVLVIIVALALSIVLAAIAMTINSVLFKKAPDHVKKKELPALMLVPELILLILIVYLGVMQPKPVISALEEGASIFGIEQSQFPEVSHGIRLELKSKLPVQ